MSINGKQIGTRFGTLYLAKNKWTEDATTGGTCERTFRCFYSEWRQHVPSLRSKHPDASYYLLQTRTAQQLESNPLLCDVTLNYKWALDAQTTADFAQVPSDLVDENDSTSEEPIERHKKFNDNDVFPTDEKIFDVNGKFIGFTWDSPWFGTTKFVVGSKTVTITQYSLTPFSAVDSRLGKLDNPGHGYGDEGKWLLITGHRGKQGIYYTLTLTWLYSAIGYVDGLYNN